MRGWGMRAACAALVVAWVGVAAPARAADLELDRTFIEIDFDQPMSVLENSSVAITTVPARDWSCEWVDDSGVQCTTDSPLPLATRVRVDVPAMMRSDGRMQRSLVLYGDTDRPGLYRELDTPWVDGVPVLILTSDHRITAGTARKHLRIEADGREWPVEVLEEVPPGERNGRPPTQLRVTLPSDLPDDTVVTLQSTAGLRSEDGPLVRVKADEIARFHFREPFRVRAARCSFRGGQAEAAIADGALALRCDADGPVRILLSDTLDEASVDALRQALPAGVTLTRRLGVTDWGGLHGSRRIARIRSEELVLTGSFTPGVDVRVVLGNALRDLRGRAMAPMTIAISPGPPTPVVHAASGSRLIADPERSGELEVINGPPVVVAALGLGERPVVADAEAPSTRGTRAAITRADTRRILAEGGTVAWAVGHTSESIELAAPQFDLAIVTTPGRTVLAWAHDWNGARPLAGARIELGVVDSGGQWRMVSEGLTGADGIARIVIGADDVVPRPNRGEPSLVWMVRATHDDRRAVRRVASRAGWWATSRRASDDLEDIRRLFLVTDRPLYRPADTLRVHGWVRDVPAGRLLTPAVEPFQLALRTSRDDASAVVEALVEPAADGSFSAEFRLPEYMVDGDYCFEAPEWDLDTETCVFIGTYRAQDLWGEASLSSRFIREGEPVALQLEAGYLSGGPASSVSVLNTSVAMRPASPADAFPAYKDFAFGDGDAEDVRLEPSKPALDDVRLDADGHATIAWPLTVEVSGRPGKRTYGFARLQVSAILGVEGGEAMAVETAPAWVSAEDAFVGLRLSPAWPAHDSPITATAVVIDRDGRRQPGGDVTLTVAHRDQDDAAAEPVATCVLVPGIETPCRVPRQRSGVYIFTASRKGAADVVLERYIHVSGATSATRTQATLSVDAAPDAHDAPMRLALDHPFATADALLVVTAGDEVLHARRVVVDGGRALLELPTYAGGRAGVTTQVLVRERLPRAARADGTREAPRYVDASVDVAVPLPPAPRSLDLRFVPEAGRPGTQVRLVVVNRAATPRTVTLAVFDDALRQLAADRWDVFDPRGDTWLSHVPRTRHGSSLWHFGGFAMDRRVNVFWPSGAAGDPAPRGWSRNDLGSVGDVLFNITAADGGALVSEELDRITVTGSRIATPPPAPVMALGRGDVERDGFMAVANVIDVAPTHGPGRRPDRQANEPATGRGPAADRSAFGARVRNAFLQTVLWEPSVTLQPGEERVFTLTLPDNLTRWHAAAWSVSGDDDFTLDTAQIEVGLPVEVRLLTPARLYPGDRARLIGNVRHTGDAAATAETALWTEGLEADAVAQVPLVAGGQAPFALHVAPTDADQARTSALRAVAAARVNGVADAVSRGITLASPRIRATRVQAGWLGRRPVRLDLPTLPRTAQDAMLQVTLLPGADALVHDWIDDLHRYPHRCWEQIISRAVAAAIALERGDGDRFPDAKAAIDEALRNIPVFQDYRGDFRYFADDVATYNGDPVLTAYSARALRLLSTLGYDVPLKAISEADGYLNLAHGWLEDTPDDHARLAYVAAGQERPRRDLTDRLWSAFDTLPLHAQVAAASAMADGRHPEAGAAVQRLMKRAPLRGEARVLQAGERSDRWMGSDLREQCALLDVLYRHPALLSESDRRALVMGLGNLYAGGIGDVDTQTGAVCLMALRALPPAGSSGVTLEVAHGHARTTLALADGAPRTFTTPASASGAVQLRGTVPGEAPASYRVEVQYTEDARQATSTAIGFALERRHAVLRDGQWVPVQGQQVREGDWVRVTLVVRTGAERHFVALTDDVPGGLQPTDLTLSGVAGLDLKAVSSEGSAWFGTRRLDPVAPKFYARYLPEGTHEVHYFARVGNAGDYLAAPAQAELMYGAATRARTGAQRLEFLPQE